MLLKDTFKRYVNHTFESNDSVAFWKVGEAYTSHDNCKIHLYHKMTTFEGKMHQIFINDMHSIERYAPEFQKCSVH